MKNRPLNSKAQMEEIINKCQVCYVGMIDVQNKPYVLPMNFGYKDDYIYIHGKQSGKKIEALKNNPDVCISFSTDHQLRYVDEEVACSWSMRYRSVLAYGKVEFINESAERVKALNIIMSHYSGKEFTFNEPAVHEVQPLKIKVEKMEGRVYGY
jgi:nitroimidazol reductase NimA-like FMN-containing flavoprotein (pyridoxamine 5'-phosphate oxidase superfamily)